MMNESHPTTKFMQLVRVRGFTDVAGSPMHEVGKVDSVFNRSVRMVKEVVAGRYGKAPSINAELTAQANRGVIDTGGM